MDGLGFEAFLKWPHRQKIRQEKSPWSIKMLLAVAFELHVYFLKRKDIKIKTQTKGLFMTKMMCTILALSFSMTAFANGNCKTVKAETLARGSALWLSKEAIVGGGLYEAERKVQDLCKSLKKDQASEYNASSSRVVNCEVLPAKYLECKIEASVECCVE